MGKKQKNIVFTIVMSGYLLFFTLMLFFGEKEEYSYSERRQLKKFPAVTKNTLETGEFTKDLEEYSLDHFPFRDIFRGWKTFCGRWIFNTRDQNGLYKKEGYLVKREYPLNEPMIDHAGEKFNEIYETYLKDKGSKCYYSVVPDKNYFLHDKYQMLSMDYEKLFSMMKEKIKEIKYLDIIPLLSIEDYYYTDTHWKQENLEKIASFLLKEMGRKTVASYHKQEIEQPFYGVYTGQWALPVKGDKLIYLTNEELESCRVETIEGKERNNTPMYDLKKTEGKDPYEMFLSGAKAIQIIENPKAEGKGELIIFRDSFGSSLAPLLVSGYHRIILIDIRYIQSKFLEQYIDFKGQDVLFLYSTLVLNQSLSLK